MLLISAATIQKTTNALGSNIPAETVAAYETTFTQALLVSNPTTTPDFPHAAALECHTELSFSIAQSEDEIPGTLAILWSQLRLRY